MSARAANPATGSVSPGGPAIEWGGTATGSGATTEASCVEGTTCDTFRLTVAAGTYTAKLVSVSLTWATVSDNYDVYIHKAPSASSTNEEANATPAIAQSTGGAPGTQERVFMDPAVHGDGDYTVRVVYLTASAGDQYQARAAVVDAPDVTATMTDSFTDRGGGKAHEGDIIDYSVTITNSGAGDAADVKFDNPAPANTSDVAGSLRMSALAINDNYDVNFNSALNVAAPGVLGNDKGIPSPTAVPIAAGTTSGGGTVTLNADGSFSYTPQSGFGGTDSFSYTATNVQPPNDSATVTITVNNQPTAMSLSNASVDENQPAGTSVGTLSTADADAADSHTYTLVAGAGDTDNALFHIDGSTLETAAPLNFEAKSSYAIRIEANDGRGGTLQKDFTITVHDLNDVPSDIALSNASVDENAASGTTVGTFSATDEDSGATHSYSFVSGAGDTDNASFQISGSTLQTGATFDFETKSSYSIRIEGNDGNGGTFQKELTISVNDVNEPATDITLTPSDVDENRPSGTAVGTLASVDPDAANTHTYSFVGGTGDSDNGSFTIDSATLKTAGAFNFETKSSYSIRVQTDDGQTGGTFAKQLTITVNNANDAPTDIVLSNSSVDENEAAGTTVGTFSTTDEDAVDVHTYGLADGGADNGSFQIINGDTLVTEASFNFEAKSTYSIRIISIDGAATSVEKDFTITVVNKNDAPSAIALTPSSVAENQPAGTTVGTLSTTDEDTADTHTYALQTGTGDNDNALFEIDGATVKATAPFDFETKSNYTIRVQTTDSATPGVAFAQAIAITVTNVNDAPVIDLDENEAGTSSTVTFAEAVTPGSGVDVAPNAVVGDQDNDNITSATITLTNHPDDADESLSVDTTGTGIAASSYDASTGVLTLTNIATKADYQQVIRTLKYNNTAAPPDATDRLINVSVNDGAVDSAVAVATVKVVPLNAPPVVDLNGAAAVGLGSSAAFVEDGGAVALAPDAEITDTDDTHLESATLTLTNRPDGNAEVIAVTTAGTAITASTYDSSTGVLTLTGHDTMANYQQVLRSATYNNVDISPDPASRSVTFVVNDGQDNSPTQTSTVSVAGNNEAPTFTAGGNVAVDEDSSAYSAGWASNISPGPADESSQTVSFEVTNDNNGLFSTQPAIAPDGTLTFTPAANQFGSATVSATLKDNGGTANGGNDTSGTATFTITLTAVNDPPTFTPGGDVTVNEDSGGYSAAWATAISAGPNESGQTVSFGVTNNNNGLFTLGGQPAIASNGNLTFTLPANAFGVATVTVSASDTGGTANNGDNTAEDVTFTITVNAVNDPPVAGTDSFETLGNTELRVDLGVGSTPNATETTASERGVSHNDSDPVEGHQIAVTSIVGCADTTAPFDCTVNNQHIVMQADGKFSYTPAPGATSGTFQYVITDDPAGAGSPASATGTVNITVHDMIWYVNGAAAGGGNGTSKSPYNNFTALNGAGGAGDVDAPGGYIFVHTSTVAGQLELEANQFLWGEGYGLSINRNLNGNGAPTTLVAAGTKPTINGGTNDAVRVTAALPAEIRGLTINSSNGNAIDVTATGAYSGAATLIISGNTFGSAMFQTIDIDAGATGTPAFTIQSNTWSGTPAATGIDVSATAGSVSLDVSSNNVSGANAIVINGSSSSITITGFSSNVISGDTLGTGISVTNAVFDATPGGSFQGVDGGDTDIGGSGSGNSVGGAGLVLTNVRGLISFSDLDIYAASGAAFAASSTTDYNAATGLGLRVQVPGGTATFEAPAGPALDVNRVQLDLQGINLTSSASTTFGLSLVNTDGSTVTTSSGSSINTSNASATAFRIDGSTGTYTYNGTINTTAGKGVELTNNSGGTISFGGTLTLSSGANAAFAATAGGSVNATGAANTLTTTTATALNVANTTIGPSGLTFRSISANGAGSGIILNNTGTAAGLTITGTSDALSGGLIQNTTGDAVLLTQTRNFSANKLRILSPARDGVSGTNVTNLTFTNGSIENAGQSKADITDSAIAFNTTASANENNIDGDIVITGNTITNPYGSGIDFFNHAGTITNLNISNNTITSSTSAVSSKEDGIQVVAYGTGNVAASVNKGTVNNNVITGFPDGDGILFLGGSQGNVEGIMGTPGSTSTEIQISNNKVRGHSAANPLHTNGIVADVEGRGKANFRIENNGTQAEPLQYIQGSAILVGGAGNVKLEFHVNNNWARPFSIAGSSGIGVGTDKDIIANGSTLSDPDINVELTNNNVGECAGTPIRVLHRDSNGTMNLKIIGNTATAKANTGVPGIAVNNGSSGDPAFNPVMCAQIQNNTASGSVDGFGDLRNGIDLYKRSTSATTYVFGIVGLSPSPATGVQAEDYVASLNPNSVAGHSADGSGFFNKKVKSRTGNNYTSCTMASFLAAAMGGVAPLPCEASCSDTHIASVAQVQSSRSNESELAPVADRIAPQYPRAADWLSRNTGAAAPRNAALLDEGALRPIVAAAIKRWEAAGVTAEQVAAMRRVEFELADLPGSYVGETIGSAVRIDRDAGGNTWFIDATPHDDSEFSRDGGGSRRYAEPSAAPAGRIDLLTTVMHELGHAVGLPDANGQNDRDNVMYREVTTGERRLPPSGAVRASSNAHAGSQFLTVGGVDIGVLPPGKSVTITYQQKIDAPLPNGTTEISNQGTVNGSNFSNVVTDDPATAAANDPTITPVSAQADLAITKTGPATFALGSNNTFTYTLTVTNNGLSANTGGFTVTDVLPADTTFQSAGSTSGATVNNQTITYTNTTGLAANATETFTIQVAVAPSAAGTTLQNSASVATNGTPDDTASNNTSSVVSTTVTKSTTTTAVGSSANPSESGQSVTFTATVTSAGGTPTGSVQFKDNGANLAAPQPLDGSGVASISGTLSTGTHTITAAYSGDANFDPSTGTLAGGQVVNPPPTPTPSPTPAPSATASPSPTASPSGTPSARPVNISTRARVETSDGVLIAGTIITGNEPKRVMIRAIGPSLTEEGVNDVLANPVLALYGADGSLITQNDNWKDSQQEEIEATTLAPTDDRESAIVRTLDPAGYTAIVSGHNGTSGIALAEIYDLDRAADSKLANISTRGRVAGGESVMIGGFMLGGSEVDGNVIIRALGPSLGDAGLGNTLADPTLELRDANGTLVLENDNWQDDSAQATKIDGAGVAPKNQLEAAIAATLPPGDYTAILAGKNGATGIGLVEIYNAP